MTEGTGGIPSRDGRRRRAPVGPTPLQWTSEELDAHPFKFSEAQRVALQAISPRRPKSTHSAIDDALIDEIETIILWEYADSLRYLEKGREAKSATTLAARVRAVAADIEAAPDRIITETLRPGEETRPWRWLLPPLLREFAALADRYAKAAQAIQFGQHGITSAGLSHKAIGMVRLRAARRITAAMRRRNLQSTTTDDSVLMRTLRLAFRACEPDDWLRIAPLDEDRLRSLVRKSSAPKRRAPR